MASEQRPLNNLCRYSLLHSSMLCSGPLAENLRLLNMAKLMLAMASLFQLRAFGCGAPLSITICRKWPHCSDPPNHPTQNHKVTTMFACGKLGETPSTQKIAKKLLKWYVWTSLTFLSVQRKMGVLRWRQDSRIWAAHLQNWNLSTSWAGRWVGRWVNLTYSPCVPNSG